MRHGRPAPGHRPIRNWRSWRIRFTNVRWRGFIYAPSDTHYWQHGYSTESDFIYVTTANLNHDQLAQLSDEVGTERSLLVLCTAFRARADLYSNLTVKKIPRQVLSRCEWGRDDYWYQQRRISQELAATIAGMDRTDFLLTLADMSNESFQVDFDDLDRELAHT